MFRVHSLYVYSHLLLIMWMISMGKILLNLLLYLIHVWTMSKDWTKIEQSLQLALSSVLDPHVSNQY